MRYRLTCNGLTACAGVRRAAQRKIKQELGVEAEDLPIEDVKFIRRILYKAESDDIWGEYEGM